jgi:hypothetical protein
MHTVILRDLIDRLVASHRFQGNLGFFGAPVKIFRLLSLISCCSFFESA